EQVIGRRMEDVVPPPNHQLVRGKFRQVIESRVSVLYEETAELPAGRRFGEITLAPVLSPKGAVTHILGAIKDVTAHREAELAQGRDAMLLANVRDSIIVTDPEGIVTYWNDGATRLFGWTAEEMVGRLYTDRFVNSEAKAVVA